LPDIFDYKLNNLLILKNFNKFCAISRYFKKTVLLPSCKSAGKMIRLSLKMKKPSLQSMLLTKVTDL